MEKDKATRLADNVTDIYIDMEYEMLMNIAGLLAQDHKMLQDNPAQWKLKQAEAMGILNKQNLKILKDHAGLTVNQLNYTLWEAGLIDLKPAEVELLKANKMNRKIIPPPLQKSPQMFRIMAAFQRQAIDKLNLVNGTLIQQAKQVHKDIVNGTAAQVLTGNKTIYQSLRSSIHKFATNGIPALIDKAGRKWSAEAYVRTVMTSTVGNIANTMQDERFKEYDVSLVEVSSHMGARPLCAPYQGRIYTIGDDPGYPNLYNDTSYGEPAGLFGINCGHNKYPYIPGQSIQRYFPYDPVTNSIAYQQSQKQRGLERSIRKAKTVHDMLLKVGDEEGAKNAAAKVRHRQQLMREFIEETGRTRRRDREQIVTKLPEMKELPKDNPFHPDNAEPLKEALKEKFTIRPPKKPAPKKEPKQPTLPKAIEGTPESVIEKMVNDTAKNVESKRGIFSELTAATLKTLKAFEKKVMKKSFETGAVVNMITGKKVWEQKGRSKSVDIRGALEANVNSQDHIITHNHPAIASFSPADLRVMIVNDFRAIRAIDISGTVYTAAVSAAIAGMSLPQRSDLAGDLVDFHRKTERDLYDQFIKAKKEGNLNPWLLKDGKNVDQNRLQALFIHLLVELTTEQFGIEYHREGGDGEFKEIPTSLTRD